jgi:hypothetical protein
MGRLRRHPPRPRLQLKPHRHVDGDLFAARRAGPDLHRNGTRRKTERPRDPKPGRIDKSDPNGQRGYVGAIWWKAALIENHGWLACVNIGRRVTT